MEELFGIGKEQPQYPWQTKFVSWAPAASMTEAERRADEARHMYERETVNREEGTGNPLLFYDTRRDLFRFSDGTFAFSREHGNWPALKEAGFFREYGM